MTDRQQLEQAIAAQEGLRGIIDDAIIDTTIAAIRRQMESLEPAAEPVSRRVLASVLFLDLAGHTRLMQGRDPEEIYEIIDRALQRLAEPVARFGGRIVRYQGDGFKAVFGLPVARENDPDNAVRAALDILATATVIAGELETTHNLSGFAARVGIDTGLVLVGGGTEGEDAVTGLPVNLAARLESAAEPNTALISHHTYQHIRGVFDLEPLEPIPAKGFDAPVPVYRVLRVKPRSFRTRRRGVEGVVTRMIGRDAEFRLLQEEYQRFSAGRESRTVLIVGEAGLGKSRLIYEFEAWVDLQPQFVQLYRGRARLETQSQPFGLLRDLFSFRWAIHDDDRVTVVGEKIRAGLQAIMGEEHTGEMEAHLIGHLLGFNFTASPFVEPLRGNPAQLRDQALFYITAYLTAAVAREPVMILLEDLHWADDSTLSVIETLSDGLAGAPLLIVGAARPTLFERHPGWMENCPTLRRIDLRQLTGEDSHALVAEILQRVEAMPEPLRDLIVSRAEGNPFYVEELVRMLIEEGVIVKGDERWTVRPEQVSAVSVPPTLTGILQARLSSLPPEERQVLQRASVVGRLFWDAAVEHVTDDEGSSAITVAEVWPALERREIISRHDETAFEGTREYIFGHTLLRDVTYESVLKRLRRVYHRRVAEWLIEAGGERAAEYADWIAGHYAQAEDGPREAQWQTKAGEQAMARYALAEALAAFNRALQLTPEDDPRTRFNILLQRERIYSLQSARDLQAADLEELEHLAKASGDLGKLAEITWRRATYDQAVGIYPAAAERAKTAYEWAVAAQDLHCQAKSLGTLGTIQMLMGNYGDGIAWMKQGLQLAQAVDAKRIQMNIVRMLGVAAEEQGELLSQAVYFEQALALARELHDRWGERRALNSLGVAANIRGQYTLAGHYFEDSLAIARNIGDRLGESTVLGNLGVISTNIGDYQQAQTLFEQALQLARETRDPTGENINLLNLAHVVSCRGQVETALAYLAEALSGTYLSEDRPVRGYVLNVTGRVLLEAGRPAESLAPLRQALALREELGQPHLVAESRALVGVAAMELGDVAAAMAEIEPVLAFLETGELETVEDQLHILWQAFRVLRAAGDPRAGSVLARAYSELQTAVDRIDEPSRGPYLAHVAVNRAILAAWVADKRDRTDE